jgi:glutathione S-transferase
MKLLMNSGSPFARKVRILARERGLAGRIQEVNVTVSPVKVSADATKANPLSQIPVLLLEDGTAVYDSSVICEYLGDLANDGETAQPGGPARWQTLRTQALCDGILTAAVLCRYEATVRPAPLRWDAWIDGQRRKMAAGLVELEAQCEAWQNTFGLPQIGTACVLGYLDFRFTEWAWRDEHPRLALWFSQISTRASVIETVPA